MPAWEYELFIQEINNAVKEENDQNKQEMDKMGIEKGKGLTDPKYFQKMQKSVTPKIDIPKISIPK